MTPHEGSRRVPVAVVVDDDPAQLDLLSELLRECGLEPRTFGWAEDALAAMASMATAVPDSGGLPALIVTDLYMPGIDGWRFCRLLRSPQYALLNKVPVLVVSATFSGEETARIAADLGVEAYLQTPLDNSCFREQVRAILEGRPIRKIQRILIVDDDFAFCDLLKEVFSSNGSEADAVFSLKEAVEAFDKTPYDVAVVDYHLPDGDGDVLLEKFRERRPGCVCLMITADAGPNLALNWMKRGAAAYLRKPFQPDYLLELCDKACRERALLRVQDLLNLRTIELRQSREAALSNNALLRSIMESPQDMLIFALDTGYRYTAFTQAHRKTMKKIWGGEIELGMNILDIISSPEDREKARINFDRALRGQHFIEVEEYGDAKLYRTIYENRYGPILGEDRAVSGLTVFVADITERKRAEEEKAGLERQFQQAQKMESVGRLAGGVAHDFNNMLQTILGNVEVALAAVAPDSPAFENLEEIQKAALRSADLNRQLLTFARRQNVDPKVLDLNLAVERLLRMMRRLIGEDIDVEWLPAEDLWPVRMDPTQVDQILANFCVNARDAIGGVGKVSIETANTIVSEASCIAHPESVPGEYVILSVSDDGCGMDKDTLAHIFEPFFTTKSAGQGTGLGLATVYGIVKQNNGFIQVVSEPGRGSSFKVFLPRHGGEVAVARTKASGILPQSSGQTVLLVEDDLSILAIGRRVLELLGYKVLTANTPGEALRLAEAHAGRIHLLLTDVVMPDMNGRDLARRLTSLYPGLKCLFMSGYTAEIILHRGVVDEGVHFIQKPFSMEDLASKVLAAIGSSKGGAASE